MKHYTMYKSIMKYLTDKDLSLNAKGFLSMILFNDEINALELSKYCSDDIQTIKDTMLELRIAKYVKYDPETNMLLAGPSRYDEWYKDNLFLPHSGHPFPLSGLLNFSFGLADHIFPHFEHFQKTLLCVPKVSLSG